MHALIQLSLALLPTLICSTVLHCASLQAVTHTPALLTPSFHNTHINKHIN